MWACRYIAEMDPEATEGEAPQLVPLTETSVSGTDEPSTGTTKQTPAAASEGTPLLSDRAGEGAHQPVGDASRAPHGERGEVSTLDGDDFVDLGSNAIITELEPERYERLAGVAANHNWHYTHSTLSTWHCTQRCTMISQHRPCKRRRRWVWCLQVHTVLG